MSKKLVAYFSATGRTAKVAELLADVVSATQMLNEKAAGYKKPVVFL